MKSTRLRLASLAAVAALVALAAPPLYAAVVSGTVSSTVSFGQQVTTSVTPYTAPAAAQFTNSYSNGTGSNQVDTLYAKALVLSAAPTTIDLTNFVDVGGNSGASFARVREWIVYNTDTNATHTVTVAAGASNGWAVLAPNGSPQTIPANGGIMRISDPASTGSGNGNVVTSSSKTVTFNPGSNTVTSYIIAAGGSAAFVPIAAVLPFVGRRLRRPRRAA